MSTTHTDPPAAETAAPKRQLTLFDSTCIIVGIIIGAGIYETSPLIASSVPTFGWLIAAWVLGGVFSFLGALSYAELATAYPKEGGDYVYLTRAFGRAPGFLFAWAQLWIVRPGSIGAMAYVFARYFDQLLPLSEWLTQRYQAFYVNAGFPAEELAASGARFGEAVGLMIYAAVSVFFLTAINVLGVREGKWTQNLLTVTKVLGLVAIVVVAFAFSGPHQIPDGGGPATDQAAKAANAEASPADANQQAQTADKSAQTAPTADSEKDFTEILSAFGLAMILIMFTYGGWNEMAYVGAEVRNPRKNILRALVLGTVAVTSIYVVVTVAFVYALGFDGLRNSQAVATQVLELGIGAWAGRIISVLICISALGAINGQIFTGARIYYAMGTEHELYGWLGRWSPRFGTPAWSLVIQAAITLLLVVSFGILFLQGHAEGGFTSMVVFTAPVFWFFLAMVGISVAELRDREPDTPRPYRVPGYPVTPILFVLSSLYMLYSTVVYAVKNQSWEALWSLAILVVGIALCFTDPRPENAPATPPEPD